MKSVTFLGPAWPYRGGIATIMERLAQVFAGRGAVVEVLTFRVQYPSWLFPGRSQFRDGDPPEGLRIERCVNSVNPFNWWRVGRRIRREAPDAVVLKYWTPFMAPCFGTIARVAKCRGGRTKFLVQLDNIVPHERRWFDGLLTRWFVRAMDGFIYMSEEVGRELALFDTTRPRLYSPHPVFDHFGDRLSRGEAAGRLGLDAGFRYLLFFGLVRHYKGVDMLLDAWSLLRDRGVTAGCRLIVAGEFYDDVVRYREQIVALGLSEDVVIEDRFVDDGEVACYFSLADLLVLPYRAATQSGVTQIAVHFGVPMVATCVGGLPEIVRDGVTGLLCDPDPVSIAGAIERALDPAVAEVLRANFAVERARFGWQAAADAIEKLYLSTQN